MTDVDNPVTYKTGKGLFFSDTKNRVNKLQVISGAIPDVFHHLNYENQVALLNSFRRKIMLVLMRRVGEKIIIGEDIEIKILESKLNQVSVGISCPKEISIYREEIYKKIQAEKEQSHQ